MSDTMPRHEPNLDMLSAYLDGQLSPDAGRSMEHHLSGCDVCSRALDRERRLLATLDRVGHVVPPPDFANAVMGRVAQTPAHRPPTPVSWERVAGWTGAAGVVLAGVVVAVLAWLLGAGAVEGGNLLAAAVGWSADLITSGVMVLREYASPIGVLLEESGKMIWRLASLALNSGWLVQMTLLILTISLNYAFTRLVASYQRRH